jgi:hypothetical protein
MESKSDLLDARADALLEVHMDVFTPEMFPNLVSGDESSRSSRQQRQKLQRLRSEADRSVFFE